MSRIRGRDTKPELLLRAALRRRGLGGYRLHWRGAPGRPDVAYPGRGIAIFVDGAFWHGHPEYFVFGKSGKAWDDKIRRNIERDREVNRALFDTGWRCIRVWDFEVLADPDAVAARLAPVISAARRQQSVSGSGTCSASSGRHPAA